MLGKLHLQRSTLVRATASRYQEAGFLKLESGNTQAGRAPGMCSRGRAACA